MRVIGFKGIRSLCLACALATLCGCHSIGRVLNPFYEEPPPEAYLGERNDSALNEGKQKGTAAREALEAMASYRRAQTPEPTYPVIYPSVVRVMWVPDHLNRYGDLVPQHFYYLQVLKDRPAVTDAFELMEQINGRDKASNIPFIHAGDGGN